MITIINTYLLFLNNYLKHNDITICNENAFFDLYSFFKNLNKKFGKDNKTSSFTKKYEQNCFYLCVQSYFYLCAMMNSNNSMHIN